MSNLPNDIESVKLYSNEYVSNTTLNRPLARLYANDQYLEAIIRSYINKPILPFIDRLYPSKPVGTQVEKSWMVGDAITDRAITLNITLDDGDNFRYTTYKILNNDENHIAISETFHESPHIVSLIETEVFIDDDNKIILKLKSTNPLPIKIVGEVTTTLPKRITASDASRYAWYLDQNPYLFAGYHSHNNLEVIDKLEISTLDEAKYKYLNLQGEYTEIILNRPTEHNHANYDLLAALDTTPGEDNTIVFKNLKTSGNGESFLSNDGTYHHGNIHSHNNISALNNIESGGSVFNFLNQAGTYSPINVSLLHEHTNKGDLDLITNNLSGNIDILNNLKNTGEDTYFLNETGEYSYLHTFANQDFLDTIQHTNMIGDKSYYLSKHGNYEYIGDRHSHSNKTILDSIGVHSKTKYLNGEGVFVEIPDTVPTGTIVQYSVDFTVFPDPPPRYFWCQGASIERALFTELYEVIGITHGNGDGILTFDLPEIDSINTVSGKEIRYMIKYTNRNI